MTKKFPCIYAECHQNEKADPLLRTIDSLGYDIYFHWTPLFNPNNFRNHGKNVFGEVVSKNILCIPRDRDNQVQGLLKVRIPS